MISTSCSLIILSKKKIKQNASFDPPLLKTLDRESETKRIQTQIELESSIYKGVKIKAGEKRAQQTLLKTSTPISQKVASLIAKKMHGLQSPSLEELKHKKVLPPFIKKFEVFEKQPIKRKIEMAGELLDACISHSIVDKVDKVRMRKKRGESSRLGGSSQSFAGPSSLTKAVKGLLISCRKMKAKDSVLEGSEVTLDKDSKATSAPFLKNNNGGRHLSIKPKSFLLRGVKSPCKATCENSDFRNSVELSHSRSLLGNSYFKGTSQSAIKKIHYLDKRSVDSIKAGELIPKIKTLFRDSLLLLSPASRKPPITASFSTTSLV